MIESQKRSDFVKRSLDAFQTYAEREPYKSRLDALRHMGMSAAVLDVVFNPETYQHVAFKDGVETELPFDETSNGIGVVVMRPGEVAKLTVTKHPLQQVAVSPVKIKTSFLDGAGAITYNSSNVSHADGKMIYTYRRPTLLLPYDDNRHYEFPSVLAHEQTHIAQQLNHQVRVFDDTKSGSLDMMVDDYNREFDAYGLQYDMFSNELDETLMDASMSTAAEVASYRKRELGSADSYIARDGLDNMRRHWIGRIVAYAHLPDITQ